MIVSRTPLRISLGGGGTDLPFYASRFGGSLLTASISKYVYITISPRIQRNIKLNYSMTEVVDRVERVKHPLIRESLKLTGTQTIEVHSIADIPSGTGLGSSAAFTVGLLNGLYYQGGSLMSKYKLAEDASHIIMDVLNEPCGKQDQYACAFGGINHLQIDVGGKVTVTPIDIPHKDLLTLTRDLMMFYTGIDRPADDILGEQQRKGAKVDDVIFEYYHEIKGLGEKSLKYLQGGELRMYGKLMDTHWKLKRGITDSMTNDRIDAIYSLALENGALGGKMIGAGGGGFMMFYVDRQHDRLRKSLEAEGLHYLPYKFDFDGSRIVYDGTHF
jgi:D-glycero-alpha-D-manno-heptose-7-phosphate kinase